MSCLGFLCFLQDQTRTDVSLYLQEYIISRVNPDPDPVGLSLMVLYLMKKCNTCQLNFPIHIFLFACWPKKVSYLISTILKRSLSVKGTGYSP